MFKVRGCEARLVDLNLRARSDFRSDGGLAIFLPVKPHFASKVRYLGSSVQYDHISI